MTRFLLALLAALTLSPASFAAQNCTQNQMVLEVDGMVCDFCTQSVKKVLEREDGVANVTIDLGKKTVTMVMKDNSVMDDAYATELIRQAGYKATSITRSCKG